MTDRSKVVILVLFLLNIYIYGVGVSCRISYSVVSFSYVSFSGLITSVGEPCIPYLYITVSLQRRRL